MMWTGTLLEAMTENQQDLPPCGGQLSSGHYSGKRLKPVWANSLTSSAALPSYKRAFGPSLMLAVSLLGIRKTRARRMGHMTNPKPPGFIWRDDDANASVLIT